MNQPAENKELEQRTDPAIRSVVLDLLKNGFIEEEEKPLPYGDARRWEQEVNAILEPLELQMKLDDMRGLLILVVLESNDSVYQIDTAWSHPLIRRRRFTLEQSLLVALLRRCFLVSEQDQGTGMNAIRVPVDELVNDMIRFTGDSGSDQKNERRVTELIGKLKEHGIVTEPDKHNEITIRPLIKYLADPDNLQALLAQYEKVAEEN